MEYDNTHVIVLRNVTIQYKIADNGILLVGADTLVNANKEDRNKFIALVAKYLIDEGFVKIGVDGKPNI